MTYEMAVARAFLGALVKPAFATWRWGFIGDPSERFAMATYALRRLRVRAGLVP